MPQPIVHFEFAATDEQKLQSFYSSLFGWKANKLPGPMPYSAFDAKQGAEFGIDGGIYKVQDANDRPGVRIYANVDSADAYMGKVEGLGGKVVVPANEVPGGGIKIGLFTDPEGNLVGVVETLSQS